MAKTPISSLIEEIKREADYFITDSDLDSLLLNQINKALKRVKQLFFDYMLYDEIGASDTFDTVALQEYIDIAAETIDFDQPIMLTERTSDSWIEIVPFSQYRKMFPDPSANSSNTPDIAAFFANRLYLGPTPSIVITLYLDYIKLIADVASGGNMPFEDKYDPLIIAMVMKPLMTMLGRKDEILVAKDDILTLKDELIIKAAKNVGTNFQTAGRRGFGFGPKKQLTRPTYGYGVGGYGEGGYGGL